MILRVVDLPWAVDHKGSCTFQEIPTTVAARQRYDAFFDTIEPELGSGGELQHMTDWGGKITGQAVRLAGLFHIVQTTEPARVPISSETMEMALEVAAVLTEHAKIALEQMGTDMAVECARKILKWLEDTQARTFTAREAYQLVKGDQRFSKMEMVKPGLEEMIDRGYIREKQIKRKPRPGRKPSPIYEIRP